MDAGISNWIEWNTCRQDYGSLCVSVTQNAELWELKVRRYSDGVSTRGPLVFNVPHRVTN